MRAIFEYGPGIPRYLGLWMVLTPLLLAGLAARRLPRPALVAVALTTLPTLARNPPWWFGLPLRLWLLGGALAFVAGWLVSRIRAPDPAVDDRPAAVHRRGPDWRAVLVLVGLALAVRIPMAWWDPGISDIPVASEIAAEQLLDGDNPYTLPNPSTQVGEYQYPAGSILAHLPFVALAPDELAGERHLGVRAAVWVGEALTVALLAWAAARAGHPGGGLAAAFAYALHPVLLREAGQTAANDLLLAALAAAAAVALSRRRPTAAAVLVGLAVSVKPAAAVLVPLLLAAAGWRVALVAVAVPAALQLPFLLWPSPGWHGVDAILEPVGRPDTLEVLRANSLWWPLYAAAGNGRAVIRAVELVAIAASTGAALWAGVALRRRGPSLRRAAAAVSLPLLVAFALASMQRTNYQVWYLAPFLLAAGLTVPARRRAPVPAPR